MSEFEAAHADFIRHTEEAEQSAKRDPAAHRRKIVLLAMYAYGYITLLLIFCVGLIGVMIWFAVTGQFSVAEIKIFFFLGITSLVLLKSLHVNFEKPEGCFISRKEAPDLFRQVDEIANALQAPKPKAVILDVRPNAAAI